MGAQLHQAGLTVSSEAGTLAAETVAPSFSTPLPLAITTAFAIAGTRVVYALFSITEAGITEPPNSAHGPWRRLSAQVNEADIRLLRDPDPLLVLVSGLALLTVLNFSNREKVKRLTVEHRKAENLRNAAYSQMGASTLQRKAAQKSEKF